MPYDYVPRSDLIKMGSMLQEDGYSGKDLALRLKKAANHLDYERYKNQSSEGILPTFGKAIASSTPGVISQSLSGLPSYIPGETVIDRTLRSGAEKIGGFVNDNWAKGTAESSAGPKWGKGMGQTWASLVGQQVPVLASMKAGSLVGEQLGPLAATATAVATAGPDPTDIPLLALSKTIGGFAGGYTSMALLETGGFSEAASKLGLDRDIMEEEGRRFGSLSGVFEQLQAIGMLNPYKGFTKKMMSTGLVKPFLKAVAKEIGVAALEGTEEVLQGKLFNKILDRAVARQNARNQGRGIPSIDLKTAESLKQDLKEGFIAGFGVAAIIRGPGVAIRGVRGLESKRYDAWKERTLKKGEKVFQDIKDNKSVEVITGTLELAVPTVAAPGTEVSRKEAKKKITPEKLGEILDELQPITIRHLGKKNGIDTNQSDEQIREELKEVVGVVDDHLISPVPEGEAVVGNKLDSIFRDVLVKAKENLESWFPGLEETFKVESKSPRENIENKAKRAEIDLYEKDVIPQIKRDIKNRKTIPDQRKALTKKLLVVDTRIKKLKVSLAEKTYALSPTAQRKRILNAFRYKALQPIVGDKKANVLLPLADTKLPSPPNLAETLSRKQYAEYVSNFHGLVVSQINSIGARDAESKILVGTAEEVDIRLDEATLIKPVKNADGTETVVPEAPVDDDGNPVELPWLRRWAALAPSLEDLAYKLSMPQLMWLDSSYMARRKKADRLYASLKTAEAHLWEKLPKALRTGEPNRRMHDLVQWMGTDGTQKAKLASTLKTPNNLKAMIARVTKVSTLKNAKEVMRHAQGLKGDYRVLYNWFTKQGFIAPDNFHKNYMPVIYTFNKDSKKGDDTLVEWIVKRRKKFGKLDKLTKGLSPEKLKSLAKIADNLRYWKDEGFITPGKSPAMAEYARHSDKAFLKQFDVISDARESYDHYIRQAIQRMVYSDMAPITSSLVLQANRILAGKSSDLFNKVIGNYLESVLGVPDNGTMWLRKKKLNTLITNPVLDMTNKGIEVFNKSPLANRFGKVEIRSKNKDINANDALRVAMTYMYATTLGMPSNFTSPVKNLTQGPLQIAAVGVQRYLTGLVHLFKPGVIKEIHNMDIRPQMSGWEMEGMGAEGGGFALAAQGMLSLFRFSDLINVFSAASSGLVGWKMVETRLKEGDTTHKEITDILWRGKKGLKVDDKEVMNSKNSVLKDPWRGVVSKPVNLMINELIDKGQMKEAKRLYVNYLVEFSQWRYGSGGTPQYMRNSIIKSVFMYTTWPTNYGDYLSRARRPGMVQRYMQVAASQVILATLLSGLGYSAWRWILMGPLPKELFPVGPLATMVESIWRIIHGSTEALAAGIIPTVPEEERTKQLKYVEQQVKSIFD